ncbi:MAG TPA: response regulator transcription factor [Bryobacteraceae bacterium]|nr:response regulator transcription factor [Bryobacteraceae bacterium]
MKKPRILLADNHTILFEGLKSLLSRQFELVGADCRSLITSAAELKPDIIVMDISIPEWNGVEAARQLRESGCPSKIVFLITHVDPGLLRETFRVGMSAYVSKRSAVWELATAIREVLAGRSYITPLVTEDIMHSFVESAVRGKAVKLSRRQKEVLQLIAEGKSHKEIAATLGISLKTVEFHKRHIIQELGISNVAELTKYAIKHGIVEA